MDFGTYAGASAGTAHLKKLEIASNNLANISTIGFKRTFIKQEEQPFEKTLAAQDKNDVTAKPDHDRYAGVSNFETFVDFTQGPINQTGNPLDVALKNPKDFFVVQSENGPRYTRAGNFTIGAGGVLCAQDGSPVLSDGGPINVDQGTPTITPDGSVIVNSQLVGRIQVVRFEDPQKNLIPDGNSHFKTSRGAPETVIGEIVPQAIEQSNVQPVTAMLDLIGVNRGFDMYSRAARSIDEMNQQAISGLGRAR